MYHFQAFSKKVTWGEEIDWVEKKLTSQFFPRGKTDQYTGFTAPTSHLIQMWIKTHRYLVLFISNILFCFQTQIYVGCVYLGSIYSSVPQWPSDISGNDWRGPVNSSPAADRMSDEIFVANHIFCAEITDV